MRVYGISVQDDDLRTLVIRLTRYGRAQDVGLAGRIGRGIANETALFGLSVGEREAILAVLDNPPPGFEELRAVLAGDQCDRR